MGSVCGKHARKSAKYEIAAAGICDAEVQSAQHSAKRTKAYHGQQDGLRGCTNSNTQQPVAVCPANTARHKPKPDPKDYMFLNLTSQTRVKLPGSVNGQQFIIDTCECCDLYIMDACAMVTVDDCKDCRIFIGPTESSIFMRNCTNCKVACITRQLRTRDCLSCDLLLMTRTRPIIESSRAISLGCFCSPYAGLAQQMATAKLNPFHNFWSDVFDFTPPARGAAGPSGQQQQQQEEEEEQQNWRLLPAGTDVVQLMGQIPQEVLMLLQHQQQDASTAAVAAVAAAAAAEEAVTCSLSPAATGDVALSEFYRSSDSTPEPVTAAAAAGRLAPAASAPDAHAAGMGAALAAAAAADLDLDLAGPEAVVLQERVLESRSGTNSRENFTGKGVTDAGGVQLSKIDHVQGNLVPPENSNVAAREAVGPRSNLMLKPSEADVQSVIVTAGELYGMEKVNQGCFVFVMFLIECRGGVLQWLAQLAAQMSPCGIAAPDEHNSSGGSSSSSCVLLRTNEAAVPPHVMKQMAAAAAAVWGKDQVKALTAAAQQHQPCVGLEFACETVEQQQLVVEAGAIGGICCSSLPAAKLFRHLGTDG